jgi:O-antigen ligase
MIKVKTNVFVIALFTVILLLVQCTSIQFSDPSYFSYASIFFVGILASVFLVIQSLHAAKALPLNIIDLAFGTFIFLLLARWIGTDNTGIYSKAAIGFALIPIYIFVKIYKSIYHIQWAIVFTGIVQIITAILQKSGFLSNTNTYFVMGGTVGNPNVLAMLLLLTIASAFFLIHRVHSPFLKNVLVAYALMAFLVIVFTKCRTALLGSIFFGIFLFFKSNWKSVSQTTKLVGANVLGVTCAGFVYLIIEKSGSMIGRFLIWQSCFAKIIEKPFWGFGDSSFHQVYPEAQRLFLEGNSNATYLKVADSPQWAYNDFIELWLEGGLITTIAFGMILISLLYCWKTQKHYNINRNNIAFLTAIIFFILAAVNFAFTAWPVLIIFIISLAWSSRMCRDNIQIKFGRKYKPRLILALILLSGNLFLGAKAGTDLLFQYRFKKLNALPGAEKYEFYSRSKEDYSLYAPFTYSYASFLSSENGQQEALGLLHRLDKECRSFQTSYQLAEAYLQLNDLKNAKLYYKESLKFIPNRILPNFQLFMIELTRKNFAKADSIRTLILYTEFKGDTVFINHLKETLSRYKINEK